LRWCIGVIHERAWARRRKWRDAKLDLRYRVTSTQSVARDEGVDLASSPVRMGMFR
jgi:hypothetical protein